MFESVHPVGKVLSNLRNVDTTHHIPNCSCVPIPIPHRLTSHHHQCQDQKFFAKPPRIPPLHLPGNAKYVFALRWFIPWLISLADFDFFLFASLVLSMAQNIDCIAHIHVEFGHRITLTFMLGDSAKGNVGFGTQVRRQPTRWKTPERNMPQFEAFSGLFKQLMRRSQTCVQAAIQNNVTISRLCNHPRDA